MAKLVELGSCRSAPMKTVSLQITYRKGKPFAAYINLAHQHSQKSVRTEAVTEDLLIDYAQDNTPLGLEVVSPGMVSIDEIQRVFDRLGLGRLEPAELEPLKAA
ncbi:MAG: DUF2283 domain-containing protein [Gemmatimonadota bacterium]|nr:DUF2283 domain-containing protein [Gemmatimonadota bacterium]